MISKSAGAQCTNCPLLHEDFVPSEFNERAMVMCVGEAPGIQEVREGRPFVGQSGMLLNAAMSEAGYVRDFASYTNVVACRPPGNREPDEVEIYCCSGRLEHDLLQAKLGTTLLLGKTAREAIAPRAQVYRGSLGDYGLYDTFVTRVIVTWHPAYVLRRPSEATGFLNDVRKAFEPPTVHVVQDAPTYTMPETYDDLATELSTAPEGVKMAYDLETNQVRWFDTPEEKANSILMMGVCWDPGKAVIIGDELLYDDLRTRELLQEFSARMLPVGHNIKFDNVFLRSHIDTKIVPYMDTLIAHYVLNENSMHGLKAIAQEEFDLHDYEKDLISEYLKSRNDEYSKIPVDKLAEYCAWDVAVTLALAERFETRLQHLGLATWPYFNLFMPANEALTIQELRGVQVDLPYLRECQRLYTEELERSQHAAGAMVGRPDINLNSWMQVGEVLWDQLQLPQSNSRKIKPRSTSAAAVAHLQGKHPFVDALLRYRRISKLKSSYIDNMLQYVDVNGRVHPNALLYGTEVGRISMRDPAVQTIPRPGMKLGRTDYDPYEDGAVIRGAIIASPGNMFGAADYSQAELRTLAYLSKEPFLLQAYKDGRDIHSEVAVAMFGEDFTHEQRVQCKMFNFSYVYGGTEYSFAEDAGLPISVAREFVKRYDRVMPVARKWKQDQFKLMRKQGYVETLFGLRRRFPLITPDNQDDARKASVHSVVAGTAAAVTVLAQTKLIMEGVPVVMSVHDSIEFDSPIDRVEEDAEHVVQVMLDTASEHMPEVPWKVDKEIGPRWVEPPKLLQLEHAST